MATLAEIRAKLKQQENRSSGNGSAGDNAIYPFWNMTENESAVFRFLPDGDEKNEFFWVERSMIKLPFAGIKGETDSKPTQVQVPCMEMYDKKTCPILSEVRGWFKDPSLEDMGRKYWKKRSYIFQGFVVSGSLKEENEPENPIRRFIIGPQIYNIIKTSLLDPDMEEMPTDYTNGIDFRLNKTSKGGYADYSTSNWSRRSRPLDDSEMHAISTYGLFNLSNSLPKEPNEVELAVIQEMFEASVDGEPYDPDRWGQYYRPAGMMPTGESRDSVSAPVVEKKPSKPVVSSVSDDDEDDYPSNNTSENVQTKPSAESSSGNNAQDILAMIRSRQNK